MHDVVGELVASCAHGHGMVVDGLEVGFAGVAHAAGGEIDGADHASDEGEGDIVEGHVFGGFVYGLAIALHFGAFGPLDFFHAEDGFEVDDVGPGACDALRGEDAVIVEHEMALGASLGDAVYHLGGLLVVAVEEIDFESFDAHGGVVVAGFVELLVQHVEDCPEDDADVFLLAVADEFGQVEVGDDGEHVAALGVVPAFVQNDVFESVLGGEVDVVAIGLLVDACLEAYAGDAPVVPPVPGHFAGTNP